IFSCSMTAKVSKKNSFSTLSYQVLWLGSGIRPPRTIPLGPNCSMIENIPPKGESFSDLICIFAMSYQSFACLFLQH
ncbi:hypothetical protein, partial [Hallella absiana]|uniref:hypothetical protein n=1 Tax=Hallella absiana TaxID=2925336 RepID=UPI0021C5F0BF